MKTLAHLLEHLGVLGDAIMLAGVVVGTVALLTLFVVIPLGIYLDVQRWRRQRPRRHDPVEVQRELERVWRAS